MTTPKSLYHNLTPADHGFLGVAIDKANADGLGDDATWDLLTETIEREEMATGNLAMDLASYIVNDLRCCIE